jgi:hypothetical protein
LVSQVPAARYVAKGQEIMTKPPLLTHHLILRSAKRVSKDGHEHFVCNSSFETLAPLAPQDEGVRVTRLMAARSAIIS